MIRAYIASPYTNGDKEENVNLQLDVADVLIDHNIAPYAPLLNHFQHLRNPRPERDWLKLDLIYLECCDILIRMKPIKDEKELPSNGADDEETKAKELKMPVFSFHTIKELNDFLDNNDFIEGSSEVMIQRVKE